MLKYVCMWGEIERIISESQARTILFNFKKKKKRKKEMLFNMKISLFISVLILLFICNNVNSETIRPNGKKQVGFIYIYISK